MIIREEIRFPLVKNRPISSSSVYMCFVKKCYVLGFVSCKCTKPLSFDSPAETDVIRRSSTTAKLFVSTTTGNRTQDLPHGKCTFYPLVHRGIHKHAHTHTSSFIILNKFLFKLQLPKTCFYIFLIF